MSADKKQLASWSAMQDRLPVGTPVQWTVGTYHVDHRGREIATGIVQSHTARNGMTQVTPDNDPNGFGDFRCMTVVLQPVVAARVVV